MTVYSSTSLKYFTSHCPKALKYHLEGKFQPKEIFQAGIAAHAVLEQIGRKQPPGSNEMRIVADAVVDELITKGHMYYGEQEPPMAPDSAFQGRDIAFSYAETNPVPKGQYEIPLAMDALGEPCPAGAPEARYRALIDCIYECEEGDEDFSGNVIAVRDYKSAWPTGEADLETIQRKGQAVLAYLNLLTPASEIHGIKMEVVNLRSHKSFSRTIWLNEEGEDTMNQWQRDILQACKAADNTSEARPGVGCIDCPWVSYCCEAQLCANRAEMPIDLVCIDGTRKDLVKRLKVLLAEESADIPGGTLGFYNEPKKILTDNAEESILEEFYIGLGQVFDPEDEIKFRDKFSAEISLLKALKLGSGNATAIAKLMFKGKESKGALQVFLLSLMEDVGSVSFGIQKEKK